jgi:hypothetical protein
MEFIYLIVYKHIGARVVVVVVDYLTTLAMLIMWLRMTGFISAHCNEGKMEEKCLA